MVDAPWGPLFVVAPVRWDGELAGVISIASPMEEVTATLSAEAGSKPLTLYRPDGHVLASTVRAVPGTPVVLLDLPPELAARFDAGDRIVVRRTAIDERPYVEASES